MKRFFIVFSIVIFYFCTPAGCEKILGVFSIPMISHQIVFRSLMEKLAERGHQITTLTTEPLDYAGKYPNLKQIDVRDGSYKIWTSIFNYGKMGEKGLSSVQFQSLIGDAFVKLTELQLQHPDMQSLLHDRNTKFDVCFVENWVEPMFPIQDRFNCSLILISSMTGSPGNFDAFNNPNNPILYPDVYSPYFEDLNFWERFDQIYRSTLLNLNYYFREIPKYDASIRRNFGDDVRSVSEIHQNADMLFINGNPIFSGIRPLVPSIIYMGHMHIRPPKPLSENLRKILDESKTDVIYFSLGSNVKSAQLDFSNRKAFLDAFKELPFTVLWKWENEILPGKPENVHIMQWMPQQDILAHPKVKVFITQGGLQSMEEAINYKVPVVALPFMLDQVANTKKIKKFMIGETLTLQTLSKETLKDAILKVIKTPVYQQNMEHLSNLIKDQPQTGIERAIWWTEYIIRNRGAKHLRSQRIPFYQRCFLDIISFIIVCAISIIFIIKWVIKLFIKTFRSKLKSE